MKKNFLKLSCLIFCLFLTSCSLNKYLTPEIESSLQKHDLRNSNQVIVVRGYGCEDNKNSCERGEYDKTYADILLLERNCNDAWEIKNHYLGRVGANGITSDKKEGDSKTPIGLFPIERGFGTEEIDTNIKYIVLNGKEYWVDDVKSKYYNQLFIDDGAEKKDWDSAEHLSSVDPEYRLAIVIEYNTSKPIKGKGSAIFMHIENNKPTHGCVGVSKSGMEEILRWLDPSAHPYIYIMP